MLAHHISVLYPSSLVYVVVETRTTRDFVRSDGLDVGRVAYYVAFGPHGPRAPSSAPGDNLKILLFTTALVGVGATVFVTLRHLGMCYPLYSVFFGPCVIYLLARVCPLSIFLAAPPPKTMNKEWEEASNERALEMKLNPLTGTLSSHFLLLMPFGLTDAFFCVRV